MKLKKLFPNIFIVLIIIDIIIVLLHFASDRHELFNLDFENNIPTYYQSMQLFLIAFLSLVFIYFSSIFTKTKETVLKVFWFCFSIVPLYLSIDEMIQLHEKASTYAKIIFGGASVDNYENQFEKIGFESADWLLYFWPILIIGVIVFLFMFKKLHTTFKKDAYLLLLGVVMFCIPFIMEYINTSPDLNMNYYEALITIEESAEMIGASTFLWFAIKQIQSLQLQPTSDNYSKAEAV